MVQGISIRNSNQRVLIANAQYGLAFVGNATYTGTAKPLSYSANPLDTPVPGSGAPFMVYQITCEFPPISFIQLVNGYFVFSSTTNVGGNTWEIVVGGNSFSTPPIVKCFARLSGPGVSGRVGLRVRDTQTPQNRCWDSTEKMLVLQRKLDWPAAANASTEDIHQDQALTGIAQPYIISTINSVEAGHFHQAQGARQRVDVFSNGWTWVNGVLTRSSRAIKRYSYLDDTRPQDNQLPAERCYIIDGNRY